MTNNISYLLKAIKLGKNTFISLFNLKQLRHMVGDISIDERNAEDLFKEGLLAYKVKEYPTALALFNEVLEQDPKYESALNAKGVVLFALGMQSDALVTFDQVISLNPMNEKARLNRQKVFAKLGPFNPEPKKPISVPPIKQQPAPETETEPYNYADEYHRNYFLYIWFSCIILFCLFPPSLLLYAILSGVFVYIDAKNINAGTEKGHGILNDISPSKWVLFVILLWVIAYLLYLYKRHEIFYLNNYDNRDGFEPPTR